MNGEDRSGIRRGEGRSGGTGAQERQARTRTEIVGKDDASESAGHRKEARVARGQGAARLAAILFDGPAAKRIRKKGAGRRGEHGRQPEPRTRRAVARTAEEVRGSTVKGKALLTSRACTGWLLYS